MYIKNIKMKISISKLKNPQQWALNFTDAPRFSPLGGIGLGLVSGMSMNLSIDT